MEADLGLGSFGRRREERLEAVPEDFQGCVVFEEGLRWSNRQPRGIAFCSGGLS